MKVEFKYDIKQPVFVLENNEIKRAIVVSQSFNNSIINVDAAAAGGNLETSKKYLIEFDNTDRIEWASESSMFYNRESFFKIMNKSWDKI